MQARFLLGPAGSGKTHRCLEEIRAELLARPDGKPLVLLAPKQATFQLERQLLGTENLAGYTRLRILSFERLAESVLETLHIPPPRQLTEEGRLMVLRALLARHADQLELFRASARLPGFAQQLNLVLRELQHHRLLPARLAALAAQVKSPPSLRAKLVDLARLLASYLDWLKTNQLQDADVLLDFAADALGKDGNRFALGGLWLDGFAEMTPQELHLLSAVLPRSERALLAFCLESEPREELPWLSTWAVVSQTFRECRVRLSALPKMSVTVEVLQRGPGPGRFVSEPALAHLEAHWTAPMPFAVANAAPDQCAAGRAIRLASCRDPETEAVLAAHEILQHVRERGGRFRDCAVLLRSLDGYHDLLRRVFTRREIPFFLDRRAPVAHHPLAELTRFSLRLAAFGWQHEDWFGALKTGLANAAPDEVDRLENAALEYGWAGEAWRSPLRLPSQPELTDWAEPVRLECIPPFIALADRLRGEVNGVELASALRTLWQTLRVESTLEQWSSEAAALAAGVAAVHATVWEQMQCWLENLELAFPTSAMRVSDWLPILEAGLANLSVGVIPPALDQVLIGTVDRSRNPELQLVILPGFNEAVFPAPLPATGLLTEAERDTLAGLGARLGPGTLRRIGHERYYGYIACTRARQRLVVTHAQRDAEDTELHPSSFVSHLQRLFPGLKPEQVGGLPRGWPEAEHACELVAPLLRQAQARREESDAAHGSVQSSESVAGQRLHSPHPDPLPKEREQADRPPANHDSWKLAPALDPILPLPEGEGRGEGNGDAITDGDVVVRSSSTDDGLDSLVQLPGLERVRELVQRLPRYPEREQLSPVLAERLYLQRDGAGRVFRSSVSRLETFAACPFRFLAEVGLRAEERRQFEVDQRERGTLQHEVLERFHHEVTSSGRRWRDVPPEDAVALIGRLVDEAAKTYRDGLFLDDERNQFTTATLKEALQRFIRVIIGWMRSYQLDPSFVELSFGLPDSPLPPWRISLGDGRALALRGLVDRVDLSPGAGGSRWCVVLDYKSGAKKLDLLLLHNGLQLQLASYLGAIQSFAAEGRIAGCSDVRPAGMFYANLRGAAASGESRDDVLRREPAQQALAYRHYGRFNADALPVLDSGAVGQPSGQFNFKLKKDGTLSAQQADPLPAAEFADLLDSVRTRLGEIGRRILAGEAAVDPYRHNNAKPCARCEMGAVCRIDARAHRFRTLAPPPR